ncbi:hypothetical protein D1P53_000780 [Cryptococcus gattii VGV]|nr:hypothetical protein D1P53_000780 [Cryptococcus gattii VGV]
MSVDLSHPDIAAARASICNPSEPTAWLILQYGAAPSTTHGPQLLLLDSGPLPVLPTWQHLLQTTHHSILFGYVQIAEKGLLLVYLTPDVGGVKRDPARAIVHSRAIGSLFPDYSAIITISHPSELTEQLITDKLALNRPSTTSLPGAAPSAPTQVVPGADGLVPDPLPPRAAGMGRDLPSLPFPTSHPQSLETQLQTSQLPPLPPLPPSPIPPSPVSKDATGANHVNDVVNLNDREIKKETTLEDEEHGQKYKPENGQGLELANGSGNGKGNLSTHSSTRKPVPALSPSPPPHSQPRTPPKPQPILLPSAPPSTIHDFAPPASPARGPGGTASTEQRVRKPSTPLSLTSRLKNTFHRSSHKDKDSPTPIPSSPTATPSSPSIPWSANSTKPDVQHSPTFPHTTPTPHSPSTPSGGKFKASSLSKVFGKRKSAGASTSTPSGTGTGTWAGADGGSKIAEEREEDRIDEFGRPPVASPSLAAAPPPPPKSPLPHPSDPSIPPGPTDDLNPGLGLGQGLATPPPPRGSSLHPHHPSPSSPSPGVQARQNITTGNAPLPLAGVPILGPQVPLPLLPPPPTFSHSHRNLDSNLERAGSPYYTPPLIPPSPAFDYQEEVTRQQTTAMATATATAPTTLQSPPSRSTSLSPSVPPTTTALAIPSDPVSVPTDTHDTYTHATEDGGEDAKVEQTRQQDRTRESILLAYDLPEIGPESDPRQKEKEKDESTVIEIVEEMEKSLPPAQSQGERRNTPTPVNDDIPTTAHPIEEQAREGEEGTPVEMEDAKAEKEGDDKQNKEEKEEGEEGEEEKEEEERQRLERQREILEAQQLAQWQAAETARWEAEESARLQREEATREAARLAAEEQARRDAEEAERFRLDEEERMRAEEAARLQKEAEDEARRQVEEEQRRQREKEEEEKRRVEEEERRKREEERRKREEEEEQERKRKEEAEEKKRTVRDGLERGKREGGVMLKGDIKPIQTIPLSKSTRISEAYEESQVKDSFKITSGDDDEGGEVFFLFTDSAEDKEFVLDGVRLCTA